MKKRYIVRICALALAIGLVLAGCDLSERSTADPLVLTGTSDGKALKITINQGNSSRAVLTPKSGDYYEIRLDNVLVSKGTLSVSGRDWTFNPSQDSPNKNTATAVFSGGTLSSLTVPGTAISNAQASTAGNNEKPLITGTVTIDKTSPKVGDTLTAAYSPGNGSGAATWQWLRDSAVIANTNSKTYTVTPADAGKTLRARVSYANQEGSITSAETAAVTDTRPDLTGTVTIDKTSPNVGETLTAAYSGNGTGTAAWQWLRGNVLISGATGSTYTAVAADAGKTLKAQVSFTGQKGSVVSEATEAVTDTDTRPALTGEVTLSMGSVAVNTATKIKVGDTLKATYSGGNGTGTATWSWWRSYGDFEEIGGATSNTYTVVAADVGFYLSAKVIYANQSGDVWVMTGVVADESGFVAVNGIYLLESRYLVGDRSLYYIVDPDSATNQTVVWTVVNAGTTGATISGDVLTTTDAGEVKIKATITNGKAVGTDYTQEFTIEIGDN